MLLKFIVFFLVNPGLYAVAVTCFVVFSVQTVRSHPHNSPRADLPICPEDENNEIILFPKPENCSEFYQCANGYLYTQHCNKDLYYCAEKEYCDYIDNCDYSGCKLNPDNKILHKPLIGDNIYIPAAVPQCPEQVDGNLTLLANPDNCSSYYECDNGEAVLMDCPPTTYFCSEKDICTWIWEPECIFNCQILNKKTSFVDDHNIEVSRTKEMQFKIRNKKSFD